jgi:hypothetical protein
MSSKASLNTTQTTGIQRREDIRRMKDIQRMKDIREPKSTQRITGIQGTRNIRRTRDIRGITSIRSPAQVLERLSLGEPIRRTRVAGTLDLDPLVVSCWLCGEDMRGIYQPIVLDHCILDGLDLRGRVFYEKVALVGCRIAAAHFEHAYFYAGLLIKDCVFEKDFEGRGIQSDGRVAIHNTVFAGHADFSGVSLRHEVDLFELSFPGGTNLLHVLANGPRERIGQEVVVNDCRFRAADMPVELEMTSSKITPLGEGTPSSTES